MLQYFLFHSLACQSLLAHRFGTQIDSHYLFSLLAENQITAVNRAMFKGLNNLKSLSLFGSQISCVTPGAFDELTSLTSLNLISNPFNCNCHMAWWVFRSVPLSTSLTP